MSSRSAAAAVQHLPERPSLEHLKHQARRRLGELRALDASVKLVEAQLSIARDYGFASWRALKAFVDRASPDGPRASWLGFYRHDPRIMTNAAVAVVRHEGRLWFETATGERLELRDPGDGRALISGLEGHFTFEADGPGPARALLHHRADRTVRLERTDAATGKAMRAAARASEADQARPRVEVPLPLEILQRYVGHYASAVGVALRTGIRYGRLIVQVAGQPELEVIPESETRFFYRQLPVQLSFLVAEDRATALIVHQNGIEQRLDRVSAEEAEQATAGIRERLAEQQRPRIPVAIDRAILGRYVGRYRVDAARTLDVTAEDGRLFIEITGQPRFEVHPESERRFFWTVVAAQISFVADTAGAATHAVLHQNGRDLPITRLPDERTPA